MLAKNDLEKIRQLIKEEITPLKREVEAFRIEVRKEFKRVNRRIDIIISGFDTEILDIKKRLN